MPTQKYQAGRIRGRNVQEKRKGSRGNRDKRCGRYCLVILMRSCLVMHSFKIYCVHTLKVKDQLKYVKTWLDETILYIYFSFILSYFDRKFHG